MLYLTDRRPTELKAAIFDFDGTLSTLRCGWEKIMLPLMVEFTDPSMEQICRDYIAESTGIQTIHQMKWLCDRVRECGNPKKAPDDPWFFKNEYNDRLMAGVAQKRNAVIADPTLRSHYLIGGADAFLKMLRRHNILLYAASGTDEADVKKEAEALGLYDYFESVNGALPYMENCSKEAVIDRLITECGLKPESILICGDGKVEIGLGKKNGCISLGIASDEERLTGINDCKKERLIRAGADAIVGDFMQLDTIEQWLFQ